MKQIQIAIDGPASSGKSTVAKIIAKNLGYTYLDTGAMYRAATYLALRHDLTEADVDQLVDLLNQYPVSFGRSEDGQQLVFVADVDVTHPIRDNEVTNNVSWVSALAPVRELGGPATTDCCSRGNRHGRSRYWDGCLTKCRIEDFPSGFCRRTCRTPL